MVRASARRPPLALRLSVRRVWLDGGCLTLSSREPPMCRPALSPLETVESTFRLLATGPQPLALNGLAIGLRRGAIGLWELRGLLFHPATDVGVQRAALVELVGRARRHRGAWMIGLVGVLLPGLRQQDACPADGRSGGRASSGGMVLVSLLEGPGRSGSVQGGRRRVAAQGRPGRGAGTAPATLLGDPGGGATFGGRDPGRRGRGQPQVGYRHDRAGRNR